MLRKLPIARKIALAASLFLAPVALILWLLAGGQGKDIRFATREVAGTESLRGLLAAEAALDQSILGGPPAARAIMQALGPTQAAFATLGLADDEAALLGAPAADPAAVRTRLRALVGSVGDRSNLILDNVLDSYYATDVVLNRLPDVLDNIADLRALAAGQAASADARAAFLVAQGGLDNVLSGMDGSLQSAIQDNTDGTLAPALQAKYDALKHAIAAFTARLRSGSAAPAAAEHAALVRQAADFAAVGTGALQAILQARVDHLRRVRWLDFLAAAALFAMAVAATHIVIQAGVVSRINRLLGTMQTLAADNDVAAVPGAGDADEVGDMARAVLVFRENRLQRVRAERAAQEMNVQRDHRQKAMDQHTMDFGRAIAGNMGALSASASVMRDSAGSLLNAAETTGAEVDVTTRGAEQSSANLANVAAAIEQMSASSAEIARRVEETAKIAAAAAAAARIPTPPCTA